ncbi:MAG: hypothetical protein R3B84_03385 [Zavarzinella sp.]
MIERILLGLGIAGVLLAITILMMNWQQPLQTESSQVTAAKDVPPITVPKSQPIAAHVGEENIDLSKAYLPAPDGPDRHQDVIYLRDSLLEVPPEMPAAKPMVPTGLLISGFGGSIVHE